MEKCENIYFTPILERSWPYFDSGSYVRINSVPGHVRLIIVLEYHLVSWIVLILCIEFKKMLIYDIVLLSLNVKYFF